MPTDKLFTGHQQEGSLYFMQARFYPSATLRAGSPALGRFLSPDSIVPGYSDPLPLLQRYSFVLNNPLRYTDHVPQLEVSADAGLQLRHSVAR